MGIKQAESDFARMCARYNIWCHKWTDVMYCPNCHRPIFMTQHTDQKDTSDAPQSIVDYIIFTKGQPYWVECKGKGGDTRFTLTDINPKQHNFLNSWADRDVPCWLFITLGDGKAPSGRDAWMIPWEFYTFCEEAYNLKDIKSIPWRPTNRKADLYCMETDFMHYKLIWSEGGWSIPDFHVLSTMYHVQDLPSLYGVTNE